MKGDTVIQYQGKEVNVSSIEKEVKKLWTKEGNFVRDITAMSLYIKIEENKCYYVINESYSGNISLN